MSRRDSYVYFAVVITLVLMLLGAVLPTALASPTELGADECADDSGETATTMWDGILATMPAPEPPAPQPPSPQGGISKKFKVTEEEVFVPRREDRTLINFGSKYINAVFGGLEQGASIGVGVQLTTADAIPGVELSGTAIVSSVLYRRFELAAYIPKLGDEDTHARFQFDYTRRTKDNFFGIGPRTPEEDKTNYDNEIRTYSATVSHDFTEHVRAGAFFLTSNASIYEGDSDKSPSTDVLFSGDPNVIPATDYAPGLFGGSRLLSYGVGAEIDYRNKEKGLTQGGYFYGRFYSTDGLEKENTFSDFGWFGGEIDGRVYIPLFSDKTSLALRGAGDFKNPKGGSQIPFYEMSFLGGRRYVRGFDTYRFRGNNDLLFQTELRQTVWSKDYERGVDVYGLADGGAVWGDNRSTTDPEVLLNDELRARNWRFGFGGGVQYRHSNEFAVRAEVAKSNEDTKFYFVLSRGF